MRLAFFSPLPPSKSGIADYSAALLEHLSPLADVTAFDQKPANFDAKKYDICVYQLGNNPFHAFVYEMALEHSGVVVMHEANLHHLIADLTIRRGDWDSYLREVERNAGAEALAYARRFVRTLERGPDYEIPMLRSVLEKSRAAIVHSEAVEGELRKNGFAGPIAKIPHGAWIVDGGERMKYRERLGLNERTPLIGVFGFLKPYKRIAESLRAFRRLVRVAPEARMILVGEAHPELPLASLLSTLDLSAQARHIGFCPIGDFNGYLSACDIVLNLRYPTVGESSGTLLRALGMGKAALVSDVGSFREYPDEICLKVPVDATEEDYLFEFLNLLVSRPEVARAMGAKARAWVERECRWESVARRYAEFCEAVINGHATGSDREPANASEPAAEPEQKSAAAIAVAGEYIASWAPVEGGSRAYVESHLTRLEKTLAVTPPGKREDRILEMGAYLQITPALKTRLGYGEVRGCYYGRAGETTTKTVTADHGETFECRIDLFDAERDRFPYDDGYFSTVLCCELLEHLAADPMWMMREINRVLKMGGHLVLTTPNIVSLRAIAGILQGFHPMLFPAYIRPRESGEVDARHNREYTPREVASLLEISGFEVTLLETGPFRDQPKPELGWVEHLLDRYMLSKEHRGDGIYAVGKKVAPVKERYPGWLYS
ncbi:MAG TPA: glycosyltransferase [Bryobacteraceae bacterium]|jgi:glycosyltransferase involved in cell wall biosynthesis/SAM-dependent methyltransferase|nr:glycosyltransferase [Bryobacteraceae bacterium]